MAYQIVVIPMILSHFQSHLPTVSLFKCDFSYSCAAVDKISTDTARHAVPLLNFLFIFFTNFDITCRWHKEMFKIIDYSVVQSHRIDIRASTCEFYLHELEILNSVVSQLYSMTAYLSI